MRIKTIQIITATLLLGLPFLAKAQVIFTEVAWMGTSNSANEEWFELYNDGSETSLSGWKVYEADGGTLVISLSGTIGAGQYFTICRTTPSVPTPLNGSCNLTGSFGGSGFNNSGESLSLKDNNGATVQSLNYSSGWPAGDSATKQTMQWTGTSWVTASPTPGSATTASGGGGGGGGSESEEEENEEAEENSTSDNTVSNSKKIYSTMKMNLTVPKTAFTNSPVEFAVEILDYDRTPVWSGHQSWNMGDGTVIKFARKEHGGEKSFYHTFEYPGSYLVTVKHFGSFFEDIEPELEDSFTVDVYAPTITVGKIYPDGAVELKNTSSMKVDLSAWRVQDSVLQTFQIPDDTFIFPNKSLVLPVKVTRLSPWNGVIVFTPNGVQAASSIKSQKIVSAPKASASKVATKESSDDGQVLGLATTTETQAPKVPKEKSSKGIIWFLLFIILVLVAVVAVVLLKRVEPKSQEDDYELLDE